MPASLLPLDTYNIRARLAPVLLVTIPLGLAGATWIGPEKIEVILTGASITLVLSILCAQLGRDAGKRKQQALFARWGGTPTTRTLAYRTTDLNPLTLARYHEQLRSLRPELPLPKNKEAENKDWKTAEMAYNSAVDFLREATREKERFPLIAEENMNYGYRRNLWAMKPTGITSTTIGLLICAAKPVTAYQHGIDPITIITTAICLLLLILWITRFTPEWVHTAGNEYAKNLLAALDKITNQQTPTTP